MEYQKIPAEKFEFCQSSDMLHDKKLATKPVGYFKDVWIRFRKNKSSVVAAIIIALLLLYAILVPVCCNNNYTTSLTDTTYLYYVKLLPKSHLFAWAGWDGCSNATLSSGDYYKLLAIEQETGANLITQMHRENYEDSTSTSSTTYYDVRIDSYMRNGMIYLTLNEADYLAVQAWQNENNIQVIYPAVDTKSFTLDSQKNDANLWYKVNKKGVPQLDADGEFEPLYKTSGADGYDSIRIEGDDGSYRYAQVGGTSTAKSYKVRVFTYTYFQYRYGFEPCFLFGTNSYGQDILTRLAAGARFSLTLAICVSAINLLIGSIYGAIEGFYGGVTDMVMERISDILSGVPFMVVAALFQLHLASKVGPVVCLLFAFVLTGWIGMASRVRMQFYRFKKQEYILAAQTLGARDNRLMFKHIFPNAMGTLITGSILVIPGVIFSESTLTYLGIVNLESSTNTSVGTLLAGGQGTLSTFPHIILFPCIFIALLEISFNLFGNGLRDAFNPSLRGVED